MVERARDQLGGEVDDAPDQGSGLAGAGGDLLGDAGDAVTTGGGVLLGGAGGALDRAGDAGGADEGGGIIDKIKDFITGGDEPGGR